MRQFLAGTILGIFIASTGSTVAVQPQTAKSTPRLGASGADGGNPVGDSARGLGPLAQAEEGPPDETTATDVPTGIPRSLRKFVEDVEDAQLTAIRARVKADLKYRKEKAARQAKMTHEERLLDELSEINEHLREAERSLRDKLGTMNSQLRSLEHTLVRLSVRLR